MIPMICNIGLPLYRLVIVPGMGCLGWFAMAQFSCASPQEPPVANVAVATGAISQSGKPTPCSGAVDHPAFNAWAKVAESLCIRCHNSDGDGAESRFVLRIPASVRDRDSISFNVALLWNLASEKTDNQSLLFAKATGGLDHGGGVVVTKESTQAKVLSTLGDSVGDLTTWIPTEHDRLLDENHAAMFDGISMMSPTRLLRRVTLSLAGRLPTKPELSSVASEGMAGLEKLLPLILDEPAFYERLREGYNDILLTRGIEDNAETLLSYDHFEKSRLWYQDYDLNDLPENERERARWKLADVYRDALLREPYELILYIVRKDRPFTEVITADYMMVSPYTARGYGIYEEIKDQFRDPKNPFEYIPAKLRALRGRDGKVQETATGWYPHSGLLSMFHYLRRYPSTETNRNRLRARMVYQHWLGVDVMALAPRSADASAVAAKYAIPVMQAPDCVVCHRTIDPLAGLFQNFSFEGYVGPRKEGWYTDMFGPGFEREAIGAEDLWRSPQWLGQKIAQDRRFAIAVVEHVYYILYGRKPALAPTDIEDPQFHRKRCAYRAQRAMLEKAADVFRQSNDSLKQVFLTLIASEFYRADGIFESSREAMVPDQQVDWNDLGVVRLLSPEQLERKIGAIFGRPWGRLRDEMAILYGGIDSLAVTDRNLDPSGAMGAVQRMMANDVACEHVAKDFRLPPAERRLFPSVELTDLPSDPAAEGSLRKAISDLHFQLLGREDEPESNSVTETLELLREVHASAKQQTGLPTNESYFCGGREEFRSEDPLFTLRSWRAVVTYLLRQREFLYE